MLKWVLLFAPLAQPDRVPVFGTGDTSSNLVRGKFIMKKLLISLMFLVLLCACAGAPRAARQISAQNMPFASHTGPGAFDGVLAQNLPYENFKKLRSLLERHFGRELNYYKGWNKNGEAHITVVTPVEYWQILRPYLSMDEINRIALKNKIQSAAPEILGMGAGRLEIDGKMEETYFVIMRAPGLVKVRRAVQKEFIKRGGAPGAFNPRDFYPHVTVAYTKRDLHIQDGVIKDMAHSHTPALDPLLRQAFGR